MKAVPIANLHRLPMTIAPIPEKRCDVVMFRSKGMALRQTVLRRTRTVKPYNIIPTHFVEVRNA